MKRLKSWWDNQSWEQKEYFKASVWTATFLISGFVGASMIVGWYSIVMFFWVFAVAANVWLDYDARIKLYREREAWKAKYREAINHDANYAELQILKHNIQKTLDESQDIVRRKPTDKIR